MPERRRPSRSAAERVAEAERTTPGALELAALVPQATRIERALLRALRLQVLPHRHAADEAELWASSLVEVRGLDGLLLRADVLEVLRSRARKVLRAPPGEAAARLREAHALLEAHHAGAPPLVQIEEQIAWLAMTSARPAQAIEGRLEVALAALVRDGRVGVARWAARALPRLPEIARQTRTAWLLSVATADRLPASGRALGVLPPPGTRVVDLASLAPHLGSVALGVRRIGDRLELGAVGPGGAAIRVPASEPRFVTVVDPAADGPVDIAVPAGTLQHIGTGWQTLALHAAGGSVWDLPVHSDDEQRWLAGVTVRVSQADGRGKTLQWLGTALDAGAFLTALPVPDLSGPLLARAAGVTAKAVHLSPQPAPYELARCRVLDQDFAVTPLPPAATLPDGARVVSSGVDERGDIHPVVGTWSDDPDQGLAVHARTRASADGCLGAPVVVDGRLAGVVYRAFEMNKAPGTDRDLRMLVGRIPRAPVPPAEAAPVTIELLPAAHGQAVLVSWGPRGDRHHLLFDGGPRSASKAIVARVQAATDRHLDLIVVSHGDADKIEGVGVLLSSGIEVGDVWFNGPRQLTRRFGETGAATAAVDRLAKMLADRGLPVNAAFDGGPVMVDAEGPLHRVELRGGAAITVLAPAPRVLETLTAAWRRAAEGRGAPSPSAESPTPDDDEDTSSPPGSAPERLTPARQFGTDRSASNGASIVLLFEYGGRTVLLPGDTHADTLLHAARRLAGERGSQALFVDLFVLPHGGSRGNVTPELFDVLEAGAYAVCTSGARFRHPDPETIELIAARRPGAVLVFNYRSETTQRWADAALQDKYKLSTRFPERGGEGVEIALAPSTPPPAAPVTPVTPDDEKITFSADAFFAAGQTELNADALAKLDDLASKAGSMNLEVVIAVGHTDAVEADSDDARMQLSVARCEQVKGYLASNGIEVNRIYIEGKGSSQPVADNQTTDGRAKNRRVELEAIGTRPRRPA